MNLKRETFRNRYQVIESNKSLPWVAKIKSSTGCRKTAEFEIDVDVSHTVAKI